MKKIVVIGGESTGKSTLCKLLADYYHTQWVPEYAREFIENLKREYNQGDLFTIAKGQIELENKLSNQSNSFLFCDTNLYVIKVWSEHKYNACDIQILNLIAKQSYDAYLLLSPDIPWSDDPLREHPDEKDRNYFFNIYKEIVESSKLPFVIIKGNENERLKAAIEFVQKLS
jgi:NadR type nicotinamide-nucleotide adenylyltransferase